MRATVVCAGACLLLAAGDVRADDAPDGPDEVCLRALAETGVGFARAPVTRGVRTPVELRANVGGLRLVPRARRPALMDCELARALADTAPTFVGLGITELTFSGAYDYRTRRASTQLSGHANGLAIDVHGLRGLSGSYDVARDFEPGVGEWNGLAATEEAEGRCIGAPRTAPGRLLRTLACRLKLSGHFRVIVTPDDDSDHRDHLHLEAFPDAVSRARRLLGVLPLRPR
jgi:hypothetical protein